MRGLAVALVGEIRHGITKAASDLKAVDAESGSSLTELCEIRTLDAGALLARVGSDPPIPLGRHVRPLQRHRAP